MPLICHNLTAGKHGIYFRPRLNVDVRHMFAQANISICFVDWVWKANPWFAQIRERKSVVCQKGGHLEVRFRRRDEIVNGSFKSLIPVGKQIQHECSFGSIVLQMC